MHPFPRTCGDMSAHGGLTDRRADGGQTLRLKPIPPPCQNIENIFTNVLPYFKPVSICTHGWSLSCSTVRCDTEYETCFSSLFIVLPVVLLVLGV